MATSTSLHLSFTPSLASSLSSLFLSHPRRRLLLQNRNFPSSLSYSASPQLTRVSIAAIEHAPSPEFDFAGEISRLDLLRTELEQSRCVDQKLRVLDSDSRVRDFARRGARVWEGMGKSEAVLLKKLVAVGQGHVIGGGEMEGVHVRGGESGLRSAVHALGDLVESWSWDRNGGAGRGSEDRKEMRMLLKILEEIEKFYDCIGGIIGYWFLNLSLLLVCDCEFCFMPCGVYCLEFGTFGKGSENYAIIFPLYDRNSRGKRDFWGMARELVISEE